MPADIHAARPLPDDVFIIDPVIHAVNLDHANVASKYGQQLYDMSYPLHTMFSPPDRICPKASYMRDIPAAALVETIFTETQTALAATHTLTLDSWFHDGFCREEKTREMTTQWPNRILAYLGADPTRELSFTLDWLEKQAEETPNAIGVKMYPHQMNPYQHWKTNDDKVMRIIEKAQALGLKSIGIHKALPNGSVPLAPYKIEDDFEQAADAFPDIAFEIIHAGMAFTEETALAIGRFPNVYANLENTFSLLYQAPRRFEDALGLMMQWGGLEKILYSSGAVVTHPQHLLELFWQFEFSDEALGKFGIPQMTEETRRAILGGNYARMAELDIAAWRARQAGDEFEKARADGLAPAWSVLTREEVAA